jgi:hypothetical protein
MPSSRVILNTIINPEAVKFTDVTEIITAA